MNITPICKPTTRAADEAARALADAGAAARLDDFCMRMNPATPSGSTGK
jgi:hypothetical protein